MNVLRQSAFRGYVTYIRVSTTSRFARLPLTPAIRGYATNKGPENDVAGRARQLLKGFGTPIDDAESSRPKTKKARTKPRHRRTKATNDDVDEVLEEIDDDGELVVRHFDELEDGRIVPSVIEKGAEGVIQSHVDELQRDIDETAQKIRDGTPVEEAPVDSRQISAADEAFLEMLKKSEPSLRTEDFTNTPDQDNAKRDMQELVDRIKVPLKEYPVQLFEPLSKLNEYLIQTAVRGPAAKVPLWSQYLKCRMGLRLAPDSLSYDFWELLWNFLSVDKQEMVLKSKRIIQLRKDIEHAGFEFTLDHRLLTSIEARVGVGEVEAAYQEWKDVEDQLDADKQLNARYWAVGSQIAIRLNELEMAIDYATKHFAITTVEHDAAVLVNLIQAYMSSSRPYGVQEALATYVRMVKSFDGKMTMELYDSCIKIFMTRERPDLAMIVYTDMMSTTENSLERQNDVHKGITTCSHSPNVYSPSDSAIDFDTLQYSLEELSWPGDHPPIELPRRLQNKFFWSKLVKKLVDDDHVDWAYTVCVRMAEVGFAADTRVWNRMISAWLRSGKGLAAQKAEQAAWLLINERVYAVKRRMEPGPKVRYIESKDKPAHSAFSIVNTMGARATADTVAIMAEHYRITNQDDKLDDLCRLVDDAAILRSPDFLNSLLHFRLEKGHRHRMWEIYTDFTKRDAVMPNWWTFQCLWKASTFHSGHIKSKSVEPGSAVFPDHRRLFAEMRSWSWHLNKEPMPEAVYHNLLQAFGHADDQIGTGIAMMAMHRDFKVYPDEQILRMVVLQLASAIQNAKEPSTSYLRRRRLNLNAVVKKRLATITDIVNHFQSARDQIALSRGEKTVRDLQGDEWGAAMLPVIGEVLRHFSLDRMKTDGTSEAVVLVEFDVHANAAVKEMTPSRPAPAPTDRVIEQSWRSISKPQKGFEAESRE